MKRALVAALVLLAPACGKSAKDPAETKPDKVKMHYEPPAGWESTTVEGMQLAWYRKDYGATIGVSAHCTNLEDVSQTTLVTQELTGIPHRVVVSQEQTKVDGRDAEDWVVEGNLDGVKMRIELVVLRETCVYDLNLVSKPETFDAARADFRTFVQAFRVGPGG